MGDDKMQKALSLLLFFLLLNLFGGDNQPENDIPGLPASPKIQNQRILPPAKKAADYSRLCRDKDVVGFWKVIKWTAYFPIRTIDWKKPAFMKFQWYIFTADGKIQTLAAGKEFKIDEVEKKLSANKTPLHFKIEKKGMMRVTSDAKKEVNELWRSAVVIKDINEKSLGIELKQGDLLQTLVGPSNKILYVRQLRKVAKTEK